VSEEGSDAAWELQQLLGGYPEIREDAITGADLAKPPLSALYREHLLALARRDGRCEEKEGGKIGPESNCQELWMRR